MESLRVELEASGQGHLLDGVDALAPAERDGYLAELRSVDWAYATRALRDALAAEKVEPEPVDPVEDVVTIKSSTPAQLAAWRKAGLGFVREGGLAVVILAGGQGTRLGSAAPKGTFDIGLPSGKSLFQLHSERVLGLERLAGAAPGSVPLVIVTSDATDGPTREFFASRDRFGLLPSQLLFAKQGALPAFDEASGRAIRASPSRLALSPDGNGGAYAALAGASGALAALEAAGVRALDVCSVDNALARPGDPAWVGACLERGSDCASRVLPKARPDEAVGVFAVGRVPPAGAATGPLRVVEYSELDPARAREVDPGTGRLRFNWSNICRHWFSTDFVRGAARGVAEAPRFHVARKKIKTSGGDVPGVKLEAFIFDAFEAARRPTLVEGSRLDEFAPVKNAAGADSPATARALVLELHSRWLRRAGLPVGAGEVSPLESFDGSEMGAVDATAGAAASAPAAAVAAETAPLPRALAA